MDRTGTFLSVRLVLGALGAVEIVRLRIKPDSKNGGMRGMSWTARDSGEAHRGSGKGDGCFIQK